MVQVIPRKVAPQKSLVKKILPWSSLFLIALMVILYFVFDFQAKRAETSLVEVKNELGRTQTEEQAELQKIVLGFQKRIEDVAILLKDREKVSDILAFLETYIHPKVYFDSMTLNIETRLINLQGISEDFTSLGQQIFAFQQDPFIKEVKLSNVSLSVEGGVKFVIELFLPDKSEDITKK
ncbi:PilN domain-containing protein [Patescibacteria group bacterium]|nr:PilN domain-containing protein [Patescibacteria group bacterium]MBU4162259.1 PilN domain-containing protein [Patescibacteria group bacterium]